ncbi:SufS family cysteine desulfurase [Oleispirillum naphthae]|uniref:SufS family cysteine desulfurase n=1 Tax=Oleispirillum naphthae TaxID=2838853 RepID=UPI0030826A21
MNGPLGEITTVAGRNSFDVAAVRRDFPILSILVHGKPLVFLDNGASAQKPEAVLQAMDTMYRTSYANVHRGIYALSDAATGMYEAARETVRRFLGAADASEIVFTSGGTDSLNLVARCWGQSFLKPGDEVLVCESEHHSNIVPWQLAAAATGAVVRPIPVTDAGVFDFDAFTAMLSPKVKAVAVAHMSNVLGTIMPIKRIAAAAHAAGAIVVADGCQGAVHQTVDVQDLDVDFYAITGHKIYGPTGIGALYGKRALLDALPPYKGGGDMIETVSFERSTWAEPPARFEAGTPMIVEAIGLAAAIDYIEGLGLARIHAHEAEVLAHATDLLGRIPGVRIVGTAPDKGGVLSFVAEGAHPADIATLLDQRGIAVRAGHHCAQPLMVRMGVSATTRASFALYNTLAEAEALASGVERALAMLR